MSDSSLIVQRGCAPSRQFPLLQTLTRATREELALIRAFWEQQPERIFGAPLGDHRTPRPGIDPVDGTRSFALDLVQWAEKQYDRSETVEQHRHLTVGNWEAPLCTPTVLSVHDPMVFRQAKAAYSADCIGSGKPVRNPFVYQQRRWICTSFTTIGQPEAACHEIVPLGEYASLELHSPLPGSLTGKHVAFGGAQWIITCGQLIVSQDHPHSEISASIPTRAEPTTSALLLCIHDRALLSQAIRGFSGDLAMWQFRLREPFSYAGRTWICLAYTPMGKPQQLTSVMCREVVRLIDSGTLDVGTQVYENGSDPWTGRELRDSSGSVSWIVTSVQLIITREPLDNNREDSQSSCECSVTAGPDVHFVTGRHALQLTLFGDDG